MGMKKDNSYIVNCSFFKTLFFNISSQSSVDPVPISKPAPVEERWEESQGKYLHKKFKKMATSTVTKEEEADIIATSKTETPASNPNLVSNEIRDLSPPTMNNFPLKHNALSLVHNATGNCQSKTIIYCDYDVRINFSCLGAVHSSPNPVLSINQRHQIIHVSQHYQCILGIYFSCFISLNSKPLKHHQRSPLQCLSSVPHLLMIMTLLHQSDDTLVHFVRLCVQNLVSWTNTLGPTQMKGHFHVTNVDLLSRPKATCPNIGSQGKFSKIVWWCSVFMLTLHSYRTHQLKVDQGIDSSSADIMAELGESIKEELDGFSSSLSTTVSLSSQMQMTEANTANHRSVSFQPQVPSQFINSVNYIKSSSVTNDTRQTTRLGNKFGSSD